MLKAMAIRAATTHDLDQLLDLAAMKRAQYVDYQPRFHRPDARAREVQAPYFEGLIASSETIVLVDEEEGAIDGFIIARTGPAPPVYDPGGLTTGVDDFADRRPELWPIVGRALLDAVRSRVRDQGAVQVVVVCGPHDQLKREMLFEADLTVVTEWFSGPA